MSTQNTNPETFMQVQRKKSMVWGIFTIVGIAFALYFGFQAISQTGENHDPVSVATLQDTNTGSCVYGNATNITCNITTQTACSERKGFWSRQGTCDIRQRVEVKKKK